MGDGEGYEWAMDDAGNGQSRKGRREGMGQEEEEEAVNDG